MIKPYRAAYNEHFNQEKYDSFLNDIRSEFDYDPPFRICETPVFIPVNLKEQLLEACNDILEVLNRPDFKELTKDAIRHPSLKVPAEDYASRFLQMDFGICKDENGNPIPQLIELQGFPSLYFFQDFLTRKYIDNFDIPDRFSPHPGGVKRADYIAMLKNEIVGEANPKQVVLLEVEPEKQVTAIDFMLAEKMLGIKVLCLTKIIKRGRELFYEDKNGELIKILKIYNRVIFDELDRRDDLKREFQFNDDVDVEWVGHPNWFFRISKYTMPLLKSKYVPNCYYLDRLNEYPEDLENYVLKPLYSFAGAGVKLNVTSEMLDEIKDRENYILQQKVNYEPLVDTPDVPAKCEIRMMAIYNTKEKKSTIVNNLIRLSKGEMVGVRYNKNKEWVGASVGFFEDEVMH